MSHQDEEFRKEAEASAERERFKKEEGPAKLDQFRGGI